MLAAALRGVGVVTLVVRCLRGSRPAGALPAVVVTLLVRCLCWRCVWSPKGPRPAAGLGAAWGLGVWLSPLPTQDSSFLRSRAEVLRLRVPSVDLPPSERSEGGRSTDGGGERERILPSCGTVHTKEESFVTPTQRAPTIRHPRVRGRMLLRSRRDPVTNAESLDPDARTQNLASTPCPTLSPRPQTSAVASRPVEALAETTPSESRGSAPASPDLPRLRTSRWRPPAAAHQQGQGPAQVQPPRAQHPDASKPPPAWAGGGFDRLRSRGASGHALGRLPWLAPFLRRARRLRPVLPMMVLLRRPASMVPHGPAGAAHALERRVGEGQGVGRRDRKRSRSTTTRRTSPWATIVPWASCAATRNRRSRPSS